MIFLKRLPCLLMLLLAAAILLLGRCPSLSKNKPFAASYPQRPITLIVPFGVGASGDLVARSLEKNASRHLGQPLLILNRVGGGGSIGWDELAAAPADGYTVGLTSLDLMVLPLKRPTKHHYPTALEPLLNISASAWLMLTRADQPFANIADVIAYSRQNPGKLRFGHISSGSVSQIIDESFSSSAELNLLHVPFRSGSEAAMALLGGHVDVVFITPSTVIEYLKRGQLKALAVSSRQRLSSDTLTDIPTFQEQGFPIIFETFYGLAVPKNMPPAIKTQLIQKFSLVLSEPEVLEQLQRLELAPVYLSHQDTLDKWLEDSAALQKSLPRQISARRLTPLFN